MWTDTLTFKGVKAVLGYLVKKMGMGKKKCVYNRLKYYFSIIFDCDGGKSGLHKKVSPITIFELRLFQYYYFFYSFTVHNIVRICCQNIVYFY